MSLNGIDAVRMRRVSQLGEQIADILGDVDLRSYRSQPALKTDILGLRAQTQGLIAASTTLANEAQARPEAVGA